jgi:very-short-patch-repair endonuclease
MTTIKSITPLPPDAHVAWLAARRHGVMSYEQLLGCGLTRAGVRHRVAAGWLHRRHPGVYAVGHPGLTRFGRWSAAILAGGDRAVLSHRSAAAYWGLCEEGAHTEITVPAARRRGPQGVLVHSGRLDVADVVVLDAIRLTRLPRTLLDLAETLTLEELVKAIDRCGRRFDKRAMQHLLVRANGRRGAKRFRQALLITRPQDVLTRSELERRALKLLAKAKLPTPEVNVRLHGLERDLLWRAQRIVVELDGREHHRDLDRDTRRDGDLRMRGYTPIRFTWRQVVNDPTWVTTVLGGEFARAAA